MLNSKFLLKYDSTRVNVLSLVVENSLMFIFDFGSVAGQASLPHIECQNKFRPENRETQMQVTRNCTLEPKNKSLW